MNDGNGKFGDKKNEGYHPCCVAYGRENSSKLIYIHSIKICGRNMERKTRFFGIFITHSTTISTSRGLMLFSQFLTKPGLP